MERDEVRTLLDISVEAADYIQTVLECGEADTSVPELLDNLHRIAAVLEEETCSSAGLMRKVHLYACNLAERMKSLLRLNENSFPDVEMSLFVRMFFLGIFKEALINSTTPS